jgi:hypothetical protein
VIFALPHANRVCVPEHVRSITASKTDKWKHRHESTEARVIYELHRHGIYW